METLPCCNSVAGHQITTNFCTCHDSTAVVPCTKFCSYHCIRIEMRVKRNFHRIWIAMEKPLVKQGPGKKTSLYWIRFLRYIMGIPALVSWQVYTETVPGAYIQWPALSPRWWWFQKQCPGWASWTAHSDGQSGIWIEKALEHSQPEKHTQHSLTHWGWDKMAIF